MILCGILPRSKLCTAVWKLLTRCIYSTRVHAAKNMDAKHSHNWHLYRLKSPRFNAFTGDTVPSFFFLSLLYKINARLEALTAILLKIHFWDDNAVSLGEQFPTFQTTVVHFILRDKQPKKRNRLESESLYASSQTWSRAPVGVMTEKFIYRKLLMYFPEASFLKTWWVHLLPGVVVFVIHTRIYGIYVDTS